MAGSWLMIRRRVRTKVSSAFRDCRRKSMSVLPISNSDVKSKSTKPTSPRKAKAFIEKSFIEQSGFANFSIGWTRGRLIPATRSASKDILFLRHDCFKSRFLIDGWMDARSSLLELIRPPLVRHPRLWPKLRNAQVTLHPSMLV
jgi:hypothetical protein